ncbi:50S ribosomal protein L25/general stress protein Ctc [Microscilla marina]|uniref:Large ribosomal subunit protein bL25 n=1 Tax=Microscilla marina ATCC 23134 TaxID=313606 RepID=A2A0I9_MICM2|nr:50S ribosomal protein L25/general stress protein Ctc [Microscilla marina]EAY23848.1 50S ribosomal protein L25 [Microscilla marina ATCC 23134]
MKTLEIIGYHRANLGKKSSKDLRRDGNVPCVLYGGDKQVHFQSPMILFRDLVYTPNIHKVLLNVEGDKYECILQDIQFHPVSEIIMHADFLQISEDKAIKMDVPVKYVGTSPGVIGGGRLVSKLNKLKVSALPTKMPEFIEVDISELELGKSVKVGALSTTEFEILNSDRSPIASVELTRAQRGKQSGTEDGEEAEGGEEGDAE